MATTYTWSVVNMERRPADGVVHTVYWHLEAEDGTFGLGLDGSVELGEPAEGDPVVSYEALTEDLVCSWVCDGLGMAECDAIKAGLQEQLDELHSPSSLSGKPW